MDTTTTDSGHGRPYLLLHGGAGPASFAAFGARLASDGRVLVPTHPGFDGTERPTHIDSVSALAGRYAELLDALDLRDVCVIGNSLGGWIAAEMAVLGSPRTSAFVVVDAVGIEVAGHPLPDTASLTPAQLARRAWFDPTKAVNPTTLPPAVQAALPGNRAALAVYGGTMQDPTLLGRLSGVGIPTLVVWGEADRIGDVDYGRAYAAAIPGARFEVLARAGHLPQLEAPDELHALVRDFAAQFSRVR
jgi:pimeloyl-ACP methyl ester carboxylesterase